MTTKQTFPEKMLSQHSAVLGKTGSGKTSTAKLLIEQVVRDGSRVCILDPIKSDWWGLTSSADGKKGGLPFVILGGPRGHVPLHASAGKAIGEVVATGGLPLSIIDMADFEPGGQARFFVDFAPTLLRRASGVVYLVIEEAHLFAPKERSGVGAESMSIHWAKTLATAGRSKGIRLVLVTQRTQALHNALLGSCDTLIAHRLTAPADQEPVVKWLKANVAPEVCKEVAGSLSSLPTGTGWVCAGEAKLFERVAFPRISTYDNTATPTGDGKELQVKTTAVDVAQLKALVGDAVKEAENNDPKLLRAEISKLKAEAARKAAPARVVDAETVKAADAAMRAKIASEARAQARSELAGAVAGIRPTLATLAKELAVQLNRVADDLAIAVRAAAKANPQMVQTAGALPVPVLRKPIDKSPPNVRHSVTVRPPARGVDGPGSLNKPARAFLTALAQQGKPLSKSKLATFAGYSPNAGHTGNTIGWLRTNGLIEGSSDAIVITQRGVEELGSFTPLPTGHELLDHWCRELGKAGAALLRVLCDAHPSTLTRNELAERAGYGPDTGHFGNTLGALRSRDLVVGDTNSLSASSIFFE